MSVLATTILILVLLVGGIFLQIFLSRRESRWPGLVLPGLTLLYSLVMVLNVSTYRAITGSSVVDGTVVETVTQYGDLLSALPTMLIVFLLGNIPTIILLAIYFACREKHRKKKQMDRMNIQDLE